MNRLKRCGTYIQWDTCCHSVAKSCPTLCKPMDCRMLSSSALHFPRVCSNSHPLSQWWYLTISSSAAIFSFCLQSFPASGSFPMIRLFALSSQSIGASASVSVLPMIIQGWFPLGLTGLISLRSWESSLAPHFETINSSVLSPLYGPTLTSVHDYWKKHSFDSMDLFQQSDVSAF